MYKQRAYHIFHSMLTVFVKCGQPQKRLFKTLCAVVVLLIFSNSRLFRSYLNIASKLKSALNTFFLATG